MAPDRRSESSSKVQNKVFGGVTGLTGQRPRRNRLAVSELQPTEMDNDIVRQTGSDPSRRPTTPCNILPNSLTQSNTGLGKHDLSVLRKKQKWLREFEIALPPVRNGMDITTCVEATLVFAQEDAGTAVCIRPEGILLTCSHCITESTQELETNRFKWLIFASGQVVKTECIAWDPIRDLALLRIIGYQSHSRAILPSLASINLATPSPSFPFVTPADLPPPLRAALICIGHPGSEDLETSKPGVKTNYDVLHVSTGAFRGYAPGQDVQDNAEIGALMHDCWTYWGHSGAPLLDKRSGRLVGLHSSWDDRTGMRRGIGLEAIKVFIDENIEHL